MHKRYFIESENGMGVRRYRTSTGSWSTNFNDAMLWGDKEFTEKKMKELRKQFDSWFYAAVAPDPNRYEVYTICGAHVYVQGETIGKEME